MEYTLGGDIYGLLAMILIGIVAPLLVGGYLLFTGKCECSKILRRHIVDYCSGSLDCIWNQLRIGGKSMDFEIEMSKIHLTECSIMTETNILICINRQCSLKFSKKK